MAALQRYGELERRQAGREVGERGRGERETGSDGGARWPSSGGCPGQTDGVQPFTTPSSHGPGRQSVGGLAPPSFAPSPSPPTLSGFLPAWAWTAWVPGPLGSSLVCWSLCGGCNRWGELTPHQRLVFILMHSTILHSTIPLISDEKKKHPRDCISDNHAFCSKWFPTTMASHSLDGILL